MKKENPNIAQAAAFMALTTLIARLLGFVRDWLIYTHFGQTYTTDAFNAAFSIPDFIYMLMVGGALSSAFIPIFSSYLATDKEDDAWKMASVVFNFTMLGVIILIAIGFIFAGPLLHLLAPDLPAQYKDLAVYLTRLMFIQTFFMALNGLSVGVLNSKQHFTTPALGGIIYNLSIIVVGAAFMNQIGIAAFSYGVVAGAVLNFMVQCPALIRSGIRYYPSLDWHNKGFREVIILMIPVLIGLSVTQFNLFVSQNLASGLAEGSITALRLAQRMMQLPLGIFAVSISIALFPTLTAQAARQEMIDFKRSLSLGIRAVFFVTLPSTAVLIALGEPIVSLAFEWNNFSSSDTIATGQALLYYSLGLFAYSSLQFLNRIYYALKDTITPVLIGIITIGLNIYLSIVLVKPMTHMGLALAYTLAGIFNMLVLTVLLRLKLGTIDGMKILSSFVQSLFISVLIYLVMAKSSALFLAMLNITPKLDEFIAISLALILGVVIYAVSSLALRMQEADIVWSMITRNIPWLKKFRPSAS